jgi:large subunit ribosomal protein L18
LSVFRSSKHIYAQIIEDETGKTLAAASTVSKDIAGDLKFSGNVEAATAVGTAIAKIALDKNIKQVVFDRNGFLYHGRVKALAEAAREAGLTF